MSAKLPVVRPREVARALERAGWVPHHQRGSHAYFYKDGVYVSVPMHARDMPPGTLRAILHDASISIDEFIELLDS